MLISSCRSSCGLPRSHLLGRRSLRLSLLCPAFQCVSLVLGRTHLLHGRLCVVLWCLLYVGSLLTWKWYVGSFLTQSALADAFRERLQSPFLTWLTPSAVLTFFSFPVTPDLSFFSASLFLTAASQAPKQPLWLSAQRVQCSCSTPTFFSWYVCGNLSLVWVP